MNNNLAELVYILDMSGSMAMLTQDTIGGYNSLLHQQKEMGTEHPDMRANVTTVLFDDRYVLLHDRADIREVPDITENEYVPRGMTAMLDAIGKTLVSVGRKLAAMPENDRPGVVSVTIITDGMENASLEYDWKTIQGMIREQREKYSWLFTFIGANIDVERTGRDLGIDRRMSRMYTANRAGTESVFRSVSAGTARVRANQTLHEKKSLADEDIMSAALDSIQ